MDIIAGDNCVDCDLLDQLLITWNAFIKFLKKWEFSRAGGFVYFHRVRHAHENRLIKMCIVEISW